MTNLNVYVLNVTPDPEGLTEFCQIVTETNEFTYEVTDVLPESKNIDASARASLERTKGNNPASKYLIIRY